MNRKTHNSGGLISIEFIVTLSLMMLLFVLLTETLIAVGRANRAQWARQRCLAAAGAQLDSVAATGKPINPAVFERLWPQLKVSIQTEPGSGDWQGLTLVRVDVQRHMNRKDIHILQSRYILLPREAQP